MVPSRGSGSLSNVSCAAIRGEAADMTRFHKLSYCGTSFVYLCGNKINDYV